MFGKFPKFSNDIFRYILRNLENYFRGKNFWLVILVRIRAYVVRVFFLVRIHGKCVFVGSHKGPFFVIRKFWW